jgi:cytochrome c biogenesis protein
MTGWARWAWRRLTAMRTAVVLLCLVALAAVPGSLLPQRNVASSPLAVANFAADHPTISPWLDRLGLFDVYASPWFAATYLLLLVSMTGCVLPRCARLWRESRAAPPAAPRHLGREAGARTWATDDAGAVLAEAERHLRSRHYRVVRTHDEVRAERGYVRELGNLVFHLSLLVLLLGIAVGRLYGYEGRVAVVAGGSFTNVVAEYDAITPSVWTDTDELEPLMFTLDSFSASFATTGSRVGEPRDFDARLTVTAEHGTEQARVRPNQPLEVNGTKFFLTGHGYAPRITLTDGTGQEVYAGPVVFLPSDPNLTSDGVLKAPDARPLPLAIDGVLLPTAASPDAPPVSAFPGLVNPVLDLSFYTGDLGLGDGTPQSVYTLDTTRLDALRDADGRAFELRMRPGDEVTLPGGAGTVRFDGVERFANFQVARDPGKEISLVASLLLLGGVTVSLAVRRHRVWVRVTGDGAPYRVTLAARSLTRRELPADELEQLGLALGRPTAPSHDDNDDNDGDRRHEEALR